MWRSERDQSSKQKPLLAERHITALATSRIQLSDHLLPAACTASRQATLPGCSLATRYSVLCSLQAWSNLAGALRWARLGRGEAFPRGGSPAAFPNIGRVREVAALPSPRFSQGSSVLWPPPTPYSASLLRFRVSPLYASLPGGVASAGPNRVSPVVLMRCVCVPPPSTPSR